VSRPEACKLAPVDEGPDTHRRTVRIDYRRAEEADLVRASAVFRAALNAYLVPAGQQPIPQDDQDTAAYRHLLRHDAERFWVAEAAVDELTGGSAGTLEDDGRHIVGWGCGLVRGDWWFLSNLFVLPEAQGLGVGARLFDLAGAGARRAGVRATVTDSLQPVSNNLYARRGLLPREILIGFEGVPDQNGAPVDLGALEPEPLTLASIPQLGEIDAEVSGVDRTVDHEFYLTEGGRYGFLFRRHGEPAAYVVASDMETVTAAGIADVSRRDGVEKVRAGVIARSEGAQRAFWGAGLRFSGTPGLLLASRTWGRLDRYIPASYGLL
jgi:GNAT superfamily N-acetyltransferase